MHCDNNHWTLYGGILCYQAVVDAVSLQQQACSTDASVIFAQIRIGGIKPGDELGRICAGLGIDYLENRSMIPELNHIQDENVILAGQIPMFPRPLQ